MKATIKRDGPGEWSFVVADEQGEILTGVAPSWPHAFAEAQKELRLLGQVDDVLPAVVRQPAQRGIELYPYSVLGSARLTHRAVDVTPRPARPSWRRWLGMA